MSSYTSSVNRSSTPPPYVESPSKRSSSNNLEIPLEQLYTIEKTNTSGIIALGIQYVEPLHAAPPTSSVVRSAANSSSYVSNRGNNGFNSPLRKVRDRSRDNYADDDCRLDSYDYSYVDDRTDFQSSSSRSHHTDDFRRSSHYQNPSNSREHYERSSEHVEKASSSHSHESKRHYGDSKKRRAPVDEKLNSPSSSKKAKYSEDPK